MTMLSVLLIFGALCGTFAGTVKAPISKNLVLVADVDGKFIYYDSTVERNWTASADYCQENGMRLLSISTFDQAEALDKAWAFPDYTGEYWTSGRDARKHRQFSWNGTDDEEISSEYLNTVYTSPFDYLTCIMYHQAYNSGPSGIHFWPCANKAYVLCERDWNPSQ